MFNWLTKHKKRSSKTNTRRRDQRGDYPQELITKPTSSKKNAILKRLHLKDSGELRKERKQKEEQKMQDEYDENIASMEPMLKGGKRKRRKSRRNK